MKRLTYVMVVLASLGLVGCATTPNPNSLDPVELQRAGSSPGRTIPTVTVLDVQFDDERAKQQNAGSILKDQIERQIRQGGGNVLQDPPTGLVRSVQAGDSLAESSVNYAVVPTITSLETEQFFTNAHWDDEEYIAPHCTFEAKITSQLTVYELPGVEQTDTIRMVSRERDKRAMDVNSGYFGERDHTECDALRPDNLVQEAARDAAFYNREAIRTKLGANGYVIGMRSGNNVNLAHITLGYNHGLESGQTILFQTPRSIKDPVAGDTITENQVVTTGTVTHLTEKTAWVRVDTNVDTIRLGQPVRPSHDPGLFGSNYVEISS